MPIAAAERGDERADSRADDEHSSSARALDVQDLALQRQDRLELAVAALLGAAAGALSLDDVDLALRRILLWQSASLPESVVMSSAPLRTTSRALRAASRAFAARTAFSTILRAVPGSLRRTAPSLSMTTFSTMPFDLARDELGFRLRVERRIGVLDADDRGEPLAHVFAGEAVLHLFEEVLRRAVVVEHAGERRAKPGEVRAAVLVVDVVRVGEDLLGVGRVPLQRDLDDDRRAAVPVGRPRR